MRKGAKRNDVKCYIAIFYNSLTRASGGNFEIEMWICNANSRQVNFLKNLL